MGAPALSRRGVRVAAGILGGALLLFVIARLALMPWAGRLEGRAERAWRAALPARPAPVGGAPGAADADAGALRAEAGARALGIELAPPRSARAREPNPPRELEKLHEALLRRIIDERPVRVTSPAVADWLRDHRAALDALAIDLISGPAPRFDAAPASRPLRSPLPCDRAEALLEEAWRLQRAQMTPGSLDRRDERVLGSGTPRLSGLVLVEEALLLHALERGGVDDRGGAQRALMAVDQLNDAVLAGASRRGEGPPLATRLLVMHLVRLQGGALRQLPFDEWPRTLVDARWRDIVLRAIEDEGHALSPARWSLVEGVGPGRAVSWALSPLDRAARARQRLALVTVIQALSEDPCDPHVRGTWVEAFDAAPRWDPGAAPWLGDTVDAWAHAARADMELGLTRAVIEHRAGRVGAPDPACPSWRFDVVTHGAAMLRLRYAGPAGASERPLPFELPLEAVP